ncbi:MAG: hypothetical protein QGG48_11360, partial [Desulfatiglandales bacterium]|nr:hypothetical protein [Desulfatiglandales bacterium]
MRRPAIPQKQFIECWSSALRKGGFQRYHNHPLDIDVLVLDEISMVDTILMYQLVKAAPSRA